MQGGEGGPLDLVVSLPYRVPDQHNHSEDDVSGLRWRSSSHVHGRIKVILFRNRPERLKSLTVRIA